MESGKFEPEKVVYGSIQPRKQPGGFPPDVHSSPEGAGAPFSLARRFSATSLTLWIVGGGWSLPGRIGIALSREPTARNTALKRTWQLRRLVTDVSEKMLIQHLKELTDDGVIRRIDFREVPPHVEYELTDFGRSLALTLAPMCEWGTHHDGKVAKIVRNRSRAGKL